MFYLCVVAGLTLFTTSCNEPELTTPAMEERKVEIVDFPTYMDYTLSTRVTPRSSKYSIGDALEYLNDGLNLLYCRPGDEYDTTVVFLDTFAIAVDGSNEIDEEDLENLGVEIAETAGDHFYLRAGSNKAPFMFEIRQAGNVQNGFLPVESWFIMEQGDPSTESDSYPYEDSWPFGFGDYQGCEMEPNGTDAADLFRRDLRADIVYGWNNGPGGYYYNRLVTVCFSTGEEECFADEMPYLPSDVVIDGTDLLNPNDPQTNDNFYERLLFYNYSFYQNFHFCLDYNEMNFHFEEMNGLATTQNDALGLGEREIVQVEVGYNFIASGTSTYSHCMQVFYANIVEAQGPETALPSTCCN